MAAPWTRDGTVRAYVVTMAPEVSGRIVELPVADNQFVHKGDLLMVIDPTNYKIAVHLAAAAVQQAQANAQNADREAKRRAELSNLAVTVEQQQTFARGRGIAKVLMLRVIRRLPGGSNPFPSRHVHCEPDADDFLAAGRGGDDVAHPSPDR
jgi:hypothetical protein